MLALTILVHLKKRRVLNKYMVHTSVVDSAPEIHAHGRALTVLFEGEEARKAEVPLEACSSLRRAHGIDDKAQAVERRLTTHDILDKVEFLADAFMEAGVFSRRTRGRRHVVLIRVLSKPLHQPARPPRVVVL